MEEGHHRGDEGSGPRSLLEGAESGSKEVAKLRAAAMDTEGLLAGIFQMLRTVPRLVHIGFTKLTAAGF